MSEVMCRYGVNPQHLPPNFILVLSGYASLCEGYLGIWPFVNLWAKYFLFRPEVLPDPKNPGAPKHMTQCGAATVVPR